VVSVTPRVFIVEKFLSNFEADSIIALATHNATIATSTVGDYDDARLTDTRTSRNTWLSRDMSAVSDTIHRRAADIMNLDEAMLSNNQNVEDMQVVHYINGQKYDAHHDWGVNGQPESRFLTMLLYLTDQADAEAGGETAFPKAPSSAGGIKVTPVKGDAVLFYNLLEDGNGDDLSLHAALPVFRGEKWLANFWVWDPKRP
jgi:prolyl 4-hydroxylase